MGLPRRYIREKIRFRHGEEIRADEKQADDYSHALQASSSERDGTEYPPTLSEDLAPKRFGSKNRRARWIIPNEPRAQLACGGCTCLEPRSFTFLLVGSLPLRLFSVAGVPRGPREPAIGDRVECRPRRRESSKFRGPRFAT